MELRFMKETLTLHEVLLIVVEFVQDDVVAGHIDQLVVLTDEVETLTHVNIHPKKVPKFKYNKQRAPLILVNYSSRYKKTLNLNL